MLLRSKLLLFGLYNSLICTSSFLSKRQSVSLSKVKVSSNVENGGMVPFTELTSVLGALDRIKRQSSLNTLSRNGRWFLVEQTGAWVLLPPRLPFAVIHFIGGAGFGALAKVLLMCLYPLNNNQKQADRLLTVSSWIG